MVTHTKNFSALPAMVVIVTLLIFSTRALADSQQPANSQLGSPSSDGYQSMGNDDDNSDSTTGSSDSIGPVIVLNGDSVVHIAVGDTYTDAGATAHDNTDGDITNAIVVTNAVNTTTADTYRVVYHVQDSAGNGASAVRTVAVGSTATSDDSSDDTAAPFSDVIPADNSPVIPAPQVVPQSAPASTNGFWNFIPFVSKSNKGPSSVAPTIKSRVTTTTAPSKAQKKSYDIVLVQYTLNGTLIHTDTKYDSAWQLDTTTLQNGTYTLNTFIHYADGTTDNGNSTFTVNNTPTLTDKIVTFIKKLFKKN